MIGDRIRHLEREVLPRVLPAGWRRWSDDGPGIWYRHDLGLRVLCSVNTYDDGKRWLHVSCSHAEKLPDWYELRGVKDLFVGRSKIAIQVLPRDSEYVNVHPNCLHLWHCLDGDPVPAFAEEGLL